jgi:hypothetical protein
LASTEESLPQQPQQQTEEKELVENENNESEEESYQPLYTNSYDLCADILEDVQLLKDETKNANRIIDAILLCDGMRNGTFLTLLELKLELLQHFLEIGK